MWLRLYGVAQSIPVTMAGAWLISGVAVSTTDATVLRTPHGPLAAGAFVEVAYHLVDGAPVAHQISTHVAPDAARIVATGEVQVAPGDDYGAWVIGGVAYQSDPALDVARQPGATVQVSAYRQADGTLTVRALRSMAGAASTLFIPLAMR